MIERKQLLMGYHPDDVGNQAGSERHALLFGEPPTDLSPGKLPKEENNYKDGNERPVPSEQQKPYADGYRHRHMDRGYPLYGEFSRICTPITEENINHQYRNNGYA
jgi:hypothetical protein